MKKCARWCPLLFILVHLSCQRNIEFATFDSDLLFPLVHGELNLLDYANSDIVSITPTDTLTLQVNDTLLSLGLEDLVEIPDSSIVNTFVVPFNGFTFPPGVPFYGDTAIMKYRIGDAKLTYAVLREAEIEVKLTNTIDKPVIFTYEMLSAKKDGVSFTVTERVEANSIFAQSYVLENYELDLRGPNQNGSNSIATLYSVMIDPNETSNHTFNLGDEFNIENTFTRITPQYLEGYFGSRDLDFKDSIEVSLFEQFPFESANIELFDLNFIVDNGIGADLSVLLKEISTRNTELNASATLNHSIISNAFQINRASQLYQAEQPVKHVQQEFNLSNDNSNLDELIEISPKRIAFDMGLSVNPFGNVSLGNDFAFYGHNLSLIMQGELPLAFSLGRLQLTDTAQYDLDLSQDSIVSNRLNRGFINIEWSNGYPLEAEAQVYIIEEDRIIDSLFAARTQLKGAIQETSGEVAVTKSVSSIPVDQAKLELLEAGTFLKFDIFLSTTNSDFISLGPESGISYKVVADLNADLP